MSESQASKVLRMLKASRSGVENYKFPQSQILCYTKRISELRHDGHNILSERQVVNGHSTGVWVYHLIEVPKKRKLFGLITIS